MSWGPRNREEFERELRAVGALERKHDGVLSLDELREEYRRLFRAFDGQPGDSLLLARARQQGSLTVGAHRRAGTPKPRKLAGRKARKRAAKSRRQNR